MSNSTGHEEIWIVGTNGSGLKQLTFDSVGDELPSINNDGTIVAYQTTVSGNSQIMTAIVNAGEIDQLTSGANNFFSPSIDGAGKHVAFQGDVSGYTEIFLVTQLTSPSFGCATNCLGGRHPIPM